MYKRQIYDIPRFSEDLDFSLIRKRPVHPFKKVLERINAELEHAGYEPYISYNDKKAVNHSFVRFGSLLKEAGLSPLKEQKLSIKIEIDTDPPSGAAIETAIVNKYFPITFTTYDKASLLSGKLHALAGRKYTKGRDLFDLIWYLSKWKDIAPNIAFLKNALKQTGFKGEAPSKSTWKRFTAGIVNKCDWPKAVSDVEPFLENPSDIKLLKKENVLKLLEERG